jgi:hypothetical protein
MPTETKTAHSFVIMTKKQQVYLRVAEGLACCQRIEFELKGYLGAAMELAKKCIGQTMPFHTSAKDFENHALERLIQNFRNYTDDKELVSALNKFKDERNFLAHQALTALENPDGDLDDQEVARLHERLSKIEPEAKRLAESIFSAARNIWCHVWFDD